MKLFIVGMAILLIGYWIYSTIIERILGPDDRETPAFSLGDGVDYVPMPAWKNALIQLLNIAGIGPVIGVISGIKFGEVVFVIIPAGCILAGSVHDFVAGMMSLRNRGANLTELVKQTTNKWIYLAFSIFLCLALLLVVAVFINVPAVLCASLLPISHGFIWSLLVIFLYYICATVFPVDKIIGKIYPLFGIILIVGTMAVFVSLMINVWRQPELLTETPAFVAGMFTPEKNQPIIPLLFVTIACGIMSGFHATQAPIIARTLKSERHAKKCFFGMMTLEGFIAMVWAAGAMAIYNKFPEFMSANPNNTLLKITNTFLGNSISMVVVISVIILAVTSGDTALRSLRLSLAEALNVSQKNIVKRILMTLPLVILVALLLWWSNCNKNGFNLLWNYFAWGNQVIAAFTLMIGTIFLIRDRKTALITIVPGIFITFVVITYILWISPAHGGPVGVGLDLPDAMLAAGAFATAFYAWAISHGKKLAASDSLKQ